MAIKKTKKSNSDPGLMTTLPEYQLKDINISLRSRIFTRLLRWVLRPMLSHFIKGGRAKMAAGHVFLASRPCKDTAGLPQHFRYINSVPGPTVGDFGDSAEDRANRKVILWLHGGGFLIPASEETHLRMLALLCKDLGACGFLPDYRIAPFNQFPHSLDDCERAYAGLLELGFKAENIWLGGDSAGGNLALATLLRIRKANLPMPACVTPVSPVTEMARIHYPPSRARMAGKDAILPVSKLGLVDDLYAQNWDASDPELSPIVADYRELPPMHFIVGEKEVLRDDTLIAAQRAKDAGVEVTLDVWPVLPHAFPLFEPLYPETAVARKDMLDFAARHLARGVET